MKRALHSIALLAYGLLGAQQSYNMDLLGHLPYQSGVNDVWGYVDNNGLEYAIVGVVNGTSFVDVSVPENPIEKAFIPGPTSVWRDMKTWGNHAYIVHDSYSQGTSQGLLMVDLSQIHDGQITYDTLVDIAFERFHNIYIDENGVAYLFGGDADNGGALMYDLTENPMEPIYLGSFNETYFHDGMVRGDTLWGSAIYDGHLFAVDVQDKSNPVIIGGCTTPNAFTHNAWVSDDGNTVFTTDEVPGAYIAAVDVSDIMNMQVIDQIQTYSPESNVIPHNTHVLGNYLVTSYYCDGVTVVDASDPYNLAEVAYYDTSDSTGGTFSGAWGAYPWLPSGNILVTDRQEGLHILKIKNLEFSTSEMQELLEVSVGPNPSSDRFEIDFKANQVDYVEVYDMQGKLVQKLIPTSTSIALGNNWSQGIYTLNVVMKNELNISYQLVKN
jgi:choice-of-anchor B domain-containing protein